jgi:hypothetical protein
MVSPVSGTPSPGGRLKRDVRAGELRETAVVHVRGERRFPGPVGRDSGGLGSARDEGSRGLCFSGWLWSVGGREREGSGGQASARRGGLSPVMALAPGCGPGAGVERWEERSGSGPALGGPGRARAGWLLVCGGGFALTCACSRPAYRPRRPSFRDVVHRRWCPSCGAPLSAVG